MAKIIIKKVGEPIELVETDKIYRGDCAKQYINARAEFVNLYGQLSLGVDEEGLPKELPVNFLLGFDSAYFPVQKMVGTVVFTRVKSVDHMREIWDYELEDITEGDINYIRHILSEDYQAKLQAKFKDYGKGYAVIHKF